MFGNFSLFKTPFPGQSSVPTSFVFLFVFYIFSYLLLKTMGYFSGCLMSSAGIQKLFCGIYLAFKCSFDEFVEEKVVFPFYSSAILGPPPAIVFSLKILVLMVLDILSLSLSFFFNCSESSSATACFLSGEQSNCVFLLHGLLIAVTSFLAEHML